VKDSRVLWMGDKDLILSTGFDAVSCCLNCFIRFIDTVTNFIILNSIHCLA